MSVLIWVQTVYKCYQQTTLVGKELNESNERQVIKELCVTMDSSYFAKITNTVVPTKSDSDVWI